MIANPSLRTAGLPGFLASNRTKVIISLVTLTLVSTLITAGTYALYTASTASANNAFSSGTLTLTNNKSASTLLVLNQAFIPGDTVTGTMDVTNGGTEDLSGYQLAVALAGGAVTNNLTDATKANSYKLWVSRCSVAWTGSGKSATCAGGIQKDVVGTQAAALNVIMSGKTLVVGAATAFCSKDASQTVAVRTARGVTCDNTIDTANAVDHLMVQVQFPSAADSTYSNLATTLAFTFSGTQANGASF